MDINEAANIEEFLEYRTYFTNVFLNLDCSQSEKVLSLASDYGLLNETRRFVLAGNLNRSLEVMKNQNINVDSQILLVARKDHDELSEDYDVFEFSSSNLRRGYKLNVNKVGEYHNQKLNMLNQESVRRRADLEQIIIPTCIYVSKHFTP